MDKRTILAVLLTFLVLSTYQFYIAKYYPEVQSKRTAGVETVKEVREIPAPEMIIQEKKESLLPEEEVVVETEKYVVTLSNEGGYIKSIVLKEYADPHTNDIFKLVDVGTSEEGLFNIDSLGVEDLSRARFEIARKDGEVLFSTKLENGLELTKKYIFPPSSYHIEMELYIHNPTEQTFSSGYSIVASSNIEIKTNLDKRYTQIVSEISGKPRRDSGKRGEGHLVDGIVKFTGLQNKYFSLIAIPNIPTKGAWLRQTQSNNLLSSLEVEKFIINPKTTISHNYILYAGPTKKDTMEKYDLKSAVNYGLFGVISEALLACLRLFYRIFKNWGVAIILLAAFVNLVLFPLTRKSYESMKKIQDLQPHMERLRNEHKDSPHKLNKEMMDLYKKYNVNPMGGCLPLFLQMPVFIALYQALMRSLDLKGAEFLWIKDLSVPDAVRLPFTIPVVGNAINILPILMAAAMLVQQKIATRKGGAESVQAKQQQQMMIIMPIVFLFIMYNFPSGLVLYWLINTLLAMFEQRAIMRG